MCDTPISLQANLRSPETFTGTPVMTPHGQQLTAWLDSSASWTKQTLLSALLSTPSGVADGVLDSPPASAVLDDWLARQREDFPRWAVRYGGDWDYSPESIDRLTALVTRLTPSVQAFNDPANAEFVEGATYYLGETLRRGIPCRWAYRKFPFDRNDGAPVTADFTVQKNTNTDFTGPYDLLWYMLEQKDPGDTRVFNQEWTKIPGTP